MPPEVFGPRSMVTLREHAAGIVHHLQPTDFRGPGGPQRTQEAMEATILLLILLLSKEVSS